MSHTATTQTATDARTRFSAQNILGYAARDAKSPVAPFRFERRALRPGDVKIDILSTGGCHSDLHQAHNDWGFSQYPMVPGHEIVGRVVAVGENVTKFKVKDINEAYARMLKNDVKDRFVIDIASLKQEAASGAQA